jgi:hypothetical protein
VVLGRALDIFGLQPKEKLSFPFVVSDHFIGARGQGQDRVSKEELI